jgi:hypothetical protein
MLGGIMSAPALRDIFGVMFFAWIVANSPRIAAQALNTNLLVNPGAEASAGAGDFSTVLPPSGWNTSPGMTAVQYAIAGALDLNTADSALAGGGNNYFAGGVSNPSSTASQTVNLAGLASSIDAGNLRAVLSGYLGGFNNQNDNTTLTAVFRDKASASLGSFTIGPVLAADRANLSGLAFRSNSAVIPVGTRSVDITLLAARTDPSYNDGYADNLGFRVVPNSPGTPASGTFYWTNFGSSNAYGYGSFSWDGALLSATTTQLAPLAAFSVDGSVVVGADGNIYAGRAGNMSQINPSTGVVKSFASGVNNNTTSIDPARTTVYAGWKDTSLATLATGTGFGPGTPHTINGSETVATGLAWDNNGTVWYTTGGENVLGNVGVMSFVNFNYTTSRRLTGISATEITFDPFTGHLFTAGISGIAQINPANGTVVSTWTNPQGGGNFFQNLAVTGEGHLIAFDSNGLLRIWDFSTGSHLIGAADTIQGSFATPVLSGGMALATLPPFPLITSPLQARCTVGQPFTYQLLTTNATSRAANVPPGASLTFNASLAAITGTPTQAGTFSIGLSATNVGVTTTATLTLTVQPPLTSGPTIISSTAATGRTGRPFTFQVITTGGGSAARVSAGGLPPGLSIDPLTGLISGTPTTDGSFAVTLTVTSGNQTASSILQLTFSSDPALPVIISPNSATLRVSQSFTYSINSPSTAGQTDPTAFTLIGNLPAGLGFDPQAGTISGTFTGAAVPQPFSPDAVDLSGGIITNVQLFASNSHGTTTIPFIFYLAPTGAVNIATRLAVGTGNDVLIAGFIITGNAPKKVVVRAIAPSLTLSGTLQDPTLELHDSNGLLGANDNWGDTQQNEIIATTVPPTNNLESAIVAVINPGNYTAIVGGKNNTTGIAVVEVYDLGTASLDTSSDAKLAQISTRGKVLSGDNVMIGGFILSGSSSKVIVRAIGPSLNGILPGALQDPTLELHDGSGSTIASNDDWRSTQEQQIIDTTVPPTDNRESAIVATLPPGNYTGIVRGKGNTTGVGLVEVYGLK